MMDAKMNPKHIEHPAIAEVERLRAALDLIARNFDPCVARVARAALAGEEIPAMSAVRKGERETES